MELLSEIAFIVDTHQHLEEVGNELLHKESLELAAEILAIPEIAEALAFKAAMSELDRVSKAQCLTKQPWSLPGDR